MWALVLPLPIGRPEFPTTPIAAESKVATSPVEQSPFVQQTLEGMQPEQSPEIELGNCIITTAVKFRKLVRGNEWHCTIATSMLRLICCILSKREILKHMRIKATRMRQTKNICGQGTGH